MCAQKHRTKSIANGLVSAFAGAILVRRIGTSGVDGIVKLSEEGNNFGIVVQFPSLVQDHIFVINVRGMFLQPLA